MGRAGKEHARKEVEAETEGGEARELRRACGDLLRSCGGSEEGDKAGVGYG